MRRRSRQGKLFSPQVDIFGFCLVGSCFLFSRSEWTERCMGYHFEKATSQESNFVSYREYIISVRGTEWRQIHDVHFPHQTSHVPVLSIGD